MLKQFANLEKKAISWSDGKPRWRCTLRRFEIDACSSVHSLKIFLILFRNVWRFYSFGSGWRGTHPHQNPPTPLPHTHIQSFQMGICNPQSKVVNKLCPTAPIHFNSLSLTNLFETSIYRRFVNHVLFLLCASLLAPIL